MRQRILRRCNWALVLLLALLTGCCPGYIVTAAIKQGGILLSREPLIEVIENPSTSDELRTKLLYVVKARAFAGDMGLNPGNAFTSFAPVKGDVVSWIVMATPFDSLSPTTWWFPIVGRVPYLGFFNQNEAQQEARRLSEQGLESIVRGADAFSTLGWFDDPILSTTLKRPINEVVETIIHESVHSTVWIEGSVDFNESLATFVGVVGASQFFNSQTNKPAQVALALHEALRKSAYEDIERTMDRSETIQRLGAALNELYTSSKTREEKLQLRNEIFHREVSTEAIRRGLWPSSMPSVNNVLVAHFLLYHSQLRDFCALATEVKYDWKQFLSEIKMLSDSPNRIHRSPFELLKERTHGTLCRLPSAKD